MNFKSIFRGFYREFNLFPCPACMEGDGGGANLLCESCRGKLNFIGVEVCPGCGGELDGALALCTKCLKEKSRPFIGAVSVFNYSGFGRELIFRFKSGNSPELCRSFAHMAAAKLVESGWDFDVIIPVPLHWIKIFSRPYNQSELVACQLAEILQKPMIKGLKRVKVGRNQKKLNSAERHKNLRHAFRGNPAKVRNLRILLVDDVFTTGATMSSAAAALKLAGAQTVFVLTVARA